MTCQQRFIALTKQLASPHLRQTLSDMSGSQEPDFDDPIFLEKLDHFLAALAYAIFLTVDLAGESEAVGRGGATGWWAR